MSKHRDLDAATFFRKKISVGKYFHSGFTSPVREEIKEINYGVDMKKLVGMIKKGTLRFEE